MLKLRLDNDSIPFDLETTLKCGQLFRWKKVNNWWFGVTDSKVLKVRQTSEVLQFQGVNNEFVKNIFRLDDNLPRITSEISRDSLMKKATQAFPGLRIVRQSPWECLISFICATYKNIPAIREMIFELSRKFGAELIFKGDKFYAFPEPKALAAATVDELRECKLGFRAKRVLKTAKLVYRNQVDLNSLKNTDYAQAKSTLMDLPGVGHKVADCVLLFSLGKLEAFPVDVWMTRAICKYYSNHFSKMFISRLSQGRSISAKEYDRISSFAQSYFGRYAGYAQEYLFHFIRTRESLQGLT